MNDGYRNILHRFKFSAHLAAHADTGEAYQQLWDKFAKIYDNVNSQKPWTASRLANVIRQ